MCLINVNWSWQSTDCAAENLEPLVMLWGQRGDWPSKIWEISGAILLGFLRSLVNTIRCESIKSNRREERPIGLRTVKILRDLLLLRRTRAPKWEHACTTGRHDVKDRRARLVGSLKNANCAVRKGYQPSRTQRVKGEIWTVQLIQLGFSRSLGNATSNEANKRVMWRTEWTITACQAVLP